jgi:hypothetical protein
MVITTNIHHISPDYQQRQGSGRRRNNISRKCARRETGCGIYFCNLLPINKFSNTIIITNGKVTDINYT